MSKADIIAKRERGRYGRRVCLETNKADLCNYCCADCPRDQGYCKAVCYLDPDECSKEDTTRTPPRCILKVDESAENHCRDLKELKHIESLREEGLTWEEVRKQSIKGRPELFIK